MINNCMQYRKDYYGYIYQWTNQKTNQKYIGSHYGCVNDCYKGSGILFKPAYDANPDLFTMEVIEYISVDCKKHLIEREQYYLDQVNDIRNNPEYYNRSNYSLGGSSHITQEHIKKRSETLKEKHRKNGLSKAEKDSYQTKIKTRLKRIKETGFTKAETIQHESYGYTVEVTTPEGKTLIYPSCSKASKALGIDVQYARKVCKTKDNFKGYKVKTIAEPKIDCRGLK